MTKNNKLRIGLALNAIACMSDEETYNKIKARLTEIESIVAEEPDTEEDDRK